MDNNEEIKDQLQKQIDGINFSPNLILKITHVHRSVGINYKWFVVGKYSYIADKEEFGIEAYWNMGVDDHLNVYRVLSRVYSSIANEYEKSRSESK